MRNIANNRKGFTLIEVIASIALMAILLGGVYSVLNNTAQKVTSSMIRERAVEVARRQMELLIVSKQEPDSAGLENIDDIDESFTWQIDLERKTVGNKVPTLENTIIHATVTVRSREGEDNMAPIELHRYFSSLDPKSGNVVAVPLDTAYEYDETYQQLKELLKREPTPEEMMDYQSLLEE